MIFINALDILLYMLFNLLLATITILLCFFFWFCIVFNICYTIPVGIENARLKLSPITVANDAIDMLPWVAEKTITDLSNQKNQYIY